MNDIVIKIDMEDDGKTVGKILFNNIKISNKLLTSLKQNDGIKLNGQHVTVKGIVHLDDELRIIFAQKKSCSILPTEIPIDVLYEDDDILAVNKPRYLQVHPSHSDFEHTLGNAVMYRYRQEPFVYRPVTRLDKNTSGIVIIARTPYSANKLSEQIKTEIFKKTYIALVDGTPKPENGIINAPIARENEGNIRRCVRADGKPAVTKYEIISSHGGLSAMRVYPLTGRTHQIRVHFAYIGCPLHNDFLYGIESEPGTYFLHCSEVTFIHPINQKILTIKCEPDFTENSSTAFF